MGSFIYPQWPAPPGVKVAITTRLGGSSEGPWQSFNLGAHVGDDLERVLSNRRTLYRSLGLAAERCCWLDQVHGLKVLDLDGIGATLATADGAVTREPGRPCIVLTADCLPVLLCARNGEVVAASHCGWRGLANGILRNTLKVMAAPAEQVMAYLGPAIGQNYFIVGEEVLEAFSHCALDAHHRQAVEQCFTPILRGRKYRADLYGLARAELHALGVGAIYGGDRCTYREAAQFYSYRRDGVTGRMASLIWLSP